MAEDAHSFKKFKKGPLIFSIVFLMATLSVFLFLYRQIINNKSISEQTQIKWQEETAKREEVRSLERSLRAIEKEVGFLGSHFAQSSDIVPFLDTLEKIGSLVSVKVDIVSVDAPKGKVELLVDMKASGAFDKIYKFLLLLENSPYELEIISADFQKITDQDTSGKTVIVPQWGATLKIKLLSFFQ